MMTTRQSALYAILSGVFVLAVLAGCSAGNPHMSEAEDALEQQNYDQALTSVDSALVQDSANVDAYMLKADILRQMADSTMPPDEYKELYERARQAEEKAIKFDEGVRSDIQTQRQLAYIQEYQRGADAFNRAQQSGNQEDFLMAAGFFGAASAIEPDSSGPYLNEAYARLNAQQREETIPILETYIQKADSVEENPYTILAQLYLTNDRAEDAISLLEEATEQYPNNEELQSLRLNAYNQAGATDKAMEAYREQIEENPENATYRYNYGSLLLNAERHEEAIEQLSRAAELEPNNVKAQYNLGAAYVNRAVAFDDSLAALEDSVRQAERDFTDEEEERIRELAQKRQTAFENAIPPLERARQLSSEGDDYRQDACTALFQAYVQTEQEDRASQVEECAGYDEGQAEEMTEGDGGGNN